MSKVVRPYSAGEAGLWIQPDGPNGAVYYLGCHDVGDVTQPLGDRTLTYCPDETSVNKWKRTGSFQGEPGAVTTTITAVVERSLDWLERSLCGGPLYVTKMSCGRRDQWSSWERVFVLVNANQTSRSLTGLLARNPGDQAETVQSFEISADDLYCLTRVTAVRQAIAEPAALNAVAICAEARCKGACGPAVAAGQYAVVVSNAASPSDKGSAWSTRDGGSWVENATSPFGVGENISDVVCFAVDADTTRWLVGRGSAVSGSPARVAYSDDGGATWVGVNVGSKNGQFVTSMFSLDLYHTWLGTNDGFVYFSADGGLTWNAQTSGTLGAVRINDIHFIDPDVGMAVGNGDTVLYTEDGGVSWTAASQTGSASNLLCVAENGGGEIWWVGTDGGSLYHSENGGKTWSVRSFVGSGSGRVSDVVFVNQLVGWMVHNPTGGTGTVYRTVNGGHDWEGVVTPTNTGLNAIAAALDMHTAYAVGDVRNGTAVLVKVTAAQ